MLTINLDDVLQLNDYAEEDLDSCDTGLITSDGDHVDEGTVGDALCERAFNLTNTDASTRIAAHKKAWIIALVEIGAFHSYCGTDWQGGNSIESQLEIQGL